MILSILSLIHSNNLINAERYRSGHNEAVLKTVCPKGRVGSNPTLSATFSCRDNSLWRSTQVVKGLPC